MKVTSPLPALACALALATLAGCDNKTEEPASNSSSGTSSSAVATAASAASATKPAAVSSTPLASTLHPALLDPSKLTAKAPDLFQAQFTTTKGDFIVEVHRDWAPNAADRFYNLVKNGFYDDTRFFRVVDGFMVQWGISGDPAVSSKWMSATIPDDVVKQGNKPGYVTFAQQSSPNTRTSQIFINYGDNSRLDAQRFASFGQVIKGMDVVNQLYKGYGESPNQGGIQGQGNAYLDAKFPKLDGVKTAVIVGGK